MKQYIQNILEELYRIDPSLQSQESELILVLERLFQIKPDAVVDEAFVRSLKHQILERASENQKVVANAKSFWSRFSNTWVVGSAVACGVLLLVIGIVFTRNGVSLKQPVSFVAENRIISVGNMAFGSLFLEGEATAPLGAPETISSRTTIGFGGGGGIPAISNSVDQKMIAPYNVFTYRYIGDPLSLPDSSLPVYKRQKNMERANLVSFLQNMDLSMFDLKALKNTQVQNMTLLEDRRDGYFVNIDFLNASININPNYEQWYPSVCGNGPCTPPRPLNKEDMLGDESIVAIADQFLSQFGIPREFYGVPQVERPENHYEIMPMLKEDGAVETSMPAYIPEVVTVVYPVSIEGQEITEQMGQPYGLRINVDQRKKKVQGVWNLHSEVYEKSLYTIETDSAKILKFAERGMWGGYGFGENITLDLGTPVLVYIPHHQYEPGVLISQELYIPALRFPVTVPKDMPYAQKFVVVPLVKEILDQYEQERSVEPSAPIRTLEEPAEEPLMIPEDRTVKNP